MLLAYSDVNFVQRVDKLSQAKGLDINGRHSDWLVTGQCFYESCGGILVYGDLIWMYLIDICLLWLGWTTITSFLIV